MKSETMLLISALAFIIISVSLFVVLIVPVIRAGLKFKGKGKVPLSYWRKRLEKMRRRNGGE